MTQRHSTERPQAAADVETMSSASSEEPMATGPPKSLFREVMMVTSICSAQLMTQAGLAVAVAPLHIIGSSFHTTNVGELSWFTASFSLTVGTFILVAGRLGDTFGHRLVFLAGFLWYGLWSLLGGVSVWSDQIFFDICRAMQGAGLAMTMPNGVAILGRTYPPGMRKDVVFCLFGATAPGGFVVGAVFSSLLAERLWWPWAFWINTIACVFLVVLGLLVIPKDDIQHPTTGDEDHAKMSWLARLDIYGSVLGVTGLVLVNFAFNQGPVVGWNVPYTYALLIVGLAVLALFAFAEFHAVHPLLPRDVLTSSELAWVLGCIASGWSSFGIVVYYFFQFNISMNGNSGLLVTAKWCGAAISGAIAALVTAFFIGRVRASIMMLIAMCAFLTGQLLFATMPVHQVYWSQAFLLSIIMPWGMDISFPSGILILSNSLPHHHQGVAASIINTVVNYSISIGLGLAGTVEHYVSHDGQEELRGYRGASYMGVGLASLGVGVASAYVVRDMIKHGLK